MPLYNTHDEFTPELVEGKRPLKYALEFQLKKEKKKTDSSFGSSDSDSSVSVSDDNATDKDNVKKPDDTDIILTTDLEKIDFDYNHDSPSKIRLPQELRLENEFSKEVNMSLVYGYAPELEGLKLEYIEVGMSSSKFELIQALFSVSINREQTSDPSGIQEKLTATVHRECAFPPTHIFAVSPTHWRAKNMIEAGKTPIRSLHLAHGLLFALKCGNLPLPPPILHSEPQASADGREISLPVIPLAVPHPETFDTLLSYLYGENLAYVIASLLPTPPDYEQPLLERDSEGLMMYASDLGESYGPEMIAQHLVKVFGFWMNMCELQVFDGNLWAVTRMMWALLLEALSYSTGEPDVYACFEVDDVYIPPAPLQIFPNAPSSIESLSTPDVGFAWRRVVSWYRSPNALNYLRGGRPLRTL